MNLHHPIHCLFGLTLAFAFIAPATAGSRPPAGSKPLSEILQGVEQRASEVVLSAEFDSRSWEILACDAGGRRCREITVDPRTGKELRSIPESADDLMPPSNGKPASTIARSVEESKVGVITELEFDDSQWEVQVRAEQGRAKLYIDPISADVRRCIGRACAPRGK